MKFIKIMKWLRKMNNFNSYLAILSALDSAPIRRLGEKYSLLSRTFKIRLAMVLVLTTTVHQPIISPFHLARITRVFCAEWQKTITDGLAEYCSLIDSSSSFRAYRWPDAT